MVLNKNYNSSDEEEWDMVPDEIIESASCNEEAPTASEEAPDATVNQEEAAAPENPLPSAPPQEEEEEEVSTSLSEQQAKLGITNETSAEEIQRLLEEGAIKNESVTNQPSAEEEEMPFLAGNASGNASDKEQASATAEAQESNPEAPTTANSKLSGWLKTSLGAATQILKDVEQTFKPPHSELAAEQSKLGITDETSPEDIERLIIEASKSDRGEAGAEDADQQSTQGGAPTTEESQPSSNSNPNVRRLPGWLRSSVGAATQILTDVEEKHDLKQKTRHGLNTVGSSLRQVGSTISKEAEGIRNKVEEFDIPTRAKEAGDTIGERAKKAGETIGETAKNAGDNIAKGAKTAGDNIAKGAQAAGAKAKELNKDGKVTDFVAAAAVLGAGILLAKGKPGASAAVLATGGAAYMAAETSNGRRYDQGLNENLHMD